eukprot:m.240904 g.240904  ORF g.240904 m.240904 type:complete len:60 (+) comp15316_c2_seq4:2348-2527(+)
MRPFHQLDATFYGTLTANLNYSWQQVYEQHNPNTCVPCTLNTWWIVNNMRLSDSCSKKK